MNHILTIKFWKIVFWLLVFLAFLPLLISMYGHFLIGASGCMVPYAYEPKPAVVCNMPLIRVGTMSEQEVYLTQLIDIGILSLLTIPFLGLAAAVIGLYIVSRKKVKQ